MEGFTFKSHLKCNQCRKLSLHTISHNSHWGKLSFDWPQLCYRSNFRVTQPEHYVDSIKLDIYGKLLGRSIWEIISDWSAQSWMFENVRREREKYHVASFMTIMEPEDVWGSFVSDTLGTKMGVGWWDEEVCMEKGWEIRKRKRQENCSEYGIKVDGAIKNWTDASEIANRLKEWLKQNTLK